MNGTWTSRSVTVAGRADVVSDDVRQPEQIVRASRAQSASARFVPPVLHVAFDELPAGRPDQLLLREVGPRQRQRHACPGADRGSRTRRRAGSTRTGPRAGSSSVWYSSHRFIIRSNESSGVRTWTAPRVSSQLRRTRSSVSSAASTRPNRRTRSRIASTSAVCPSRNTSRRVSPGASVTATCSAAHGSSPAPKRWTASSLRRAPPGATASRCGRGRTSDRRSPTRGSR